MESVRAPILASNAFDQMSDTSQKDNNFMETVRGLYCELSPDKIKEWLGITTPGALRNLFEFIGANDQCIKSGIVFVHGETTCWLCGCVLYDRDKKACEHIVPALRAALFSGLVVTREIMSRLLAYGGVNEELFKTVTKNNYLWACDICNGSGVKGGIVCFTLSSDNKTFIPDIDKCLLLAEKIFEKQGTKMETCNKNFKEQVDRHKMRTGQTGGTTSLSVSKRKQPLEEEYIKIIKKLLVQQIQFVEKHGKSEAQKDEFKKKKINPKVLEICAWLIAEYSFILEAVNREFKVFLEEYQKSGVSNEQVLNCAHQAFLTYIFSLFRLYLKNAEFNLAKKEKDEALKQQLQKEKEEQENRVIEANKNLIEACQVITSWNNRQVVVSGHHSTEICDGIALGFFEKFFSKDELPHVDIKLFSSLVLSSILKAIGKEEVVTSVFTAAMECALPFVMQLLKRTYSKDLSALLPSINDDYSEDYVARLKERFNTEMINFENGLLLKLALYRLFHALCKNSYSDSDSEDGFTSENIRKVTRQTNSFFELLIDALISNGFAGLTVLHTRMPREVNIKADAAKILSKAKSNTLEEASKNYEALLNHWGDFGPTTPKSTAGKSSPLSRHSSASSSFSSSSFASSSFELDEVSSALGLTTPLSRRGPSKVASFADVNKQSACEGDDDGHYCKRMTQLFDSIDGKNPVEPGYIIEQTKFNNGFGEDLTPAEERVIAKIYRVNQAVSDNLRDTLSGKVHTEHLHTKRTINDRTPSHTSPPNDGDVQHLRSKKLRVNPSRSPSSVISGGLRVIKTKKNTKRKSYNFYKSYRKNRLHKSNKQRKTSKIYY
jgi:hypothetical protein